MAGANIQRDFNFEKLKSFGKVFIHDMGGIQVGEG